MGAYKLGNPNAGCIDVGEHGVNLRYVRFASRHSGVDFFSYQPHLRTFPDAAVLQDALINLGLITVLIFFQ
jgi:hypothetical protein